VEQPEQTSPRLYQDLAPWWPLLSAPEDYEEEAAFFHQVLQSASTPPPRTVLELGSGGGNNASFLKVNYIMTLADISPGMLAVSRQLNPQCEHVLGDMRSLRLGCLFDAVFIHDAIEYMTSQADLLLALQTGAAHCRPGGAALQVPDFTCENFMPATEHGGHNAAQGGQAARYIEWTIEPVPGATVYEAHYVYLLREANGEVRSVYDRHTCGLFPWRTWMRLLRKAGFAPRRIVDGYGRDLFLGIRNAGNSEDGA
jgi:trans-aconitate methyltransferase